MYSWGFQLWRVTSKWSVVMSGRVGTPEEKPLASSKETAAHNSQLILRINNHTPTYNRRSKIDAERIPGGNIQRAGIEIERKTGHRFVNSGHRRRSHPAIAAGAILQLHVHAARKSQRDMLDTDNRHPTERQNLSQPRGRQRNCRVQTREVRRNDVPGAV